MEPPRFSRGAILAAVVAATVLAAVGGWWYCDCRRDTPFLPGGRGADWIIAPAPPDSMVHAAAPLTATFTRSFQLTLAPTQAKLTIRAFRKASVQINGRPVDPPGLAWPNWKRPAVAEITGWLHAGTNVIVISVTNETSPPALWFRLEAGDQSLSSDESWLASLAGSDRQPAVLAKSPAVIPAWSPLYEPETTFDSLRQAWRTLAVLLAVALGLWLLGRRWFIHRPLGGNATHLTNLLLAVIVCTRLAMFSHDMPDLPRWLGFDAADHIAYVQFIQQNHALPLPKDGWEMHQPPLYYLISAGLLDSIGRSASQPETLVPLRAVNGALGVVNCWLILLCLRRVFPGNLTAQVVGLLIAAFLPVHLCLSLYVGNDVLAGTLATAAFYFLLRLLQSAEPPLWLHAALGLALGGAVLAKLTALPVVPACLLALAARPSGRQNGTRLRAWTGLALTTILCLSVAGWHFVRVWLHTGALGVPSSQGSAWWQDPGFRTAGYFLDFGRSLVSPLFSGCYSFADGIYSTWWGDGLISGSAQLMYRPPWNYDLMNAVALLSLLFTAFMALGLALTARRLFCQLEPAWFAFVATLVASLVALIYFAVSAPWTGGIKAFYALPALLPFCVMVAAGWHWTAQKAAALRAAAWGVLLLWVLAAAGSFWIPGHASETWRCRGITQFKKQQYIAAETCFIRALELNAQDPTAHYLLAETLNQERRAGEAILQYATALTLRPDYPEVLNALAGLYARGQKDDAEKAVRLAGHACRLTAARQTTFLCTLALAQANADHIPEAAATAHRAHDLAVERGEKDLAGEMKTLLEQLQPGARISQPR
jgi:tetratricopeptide (TPR) repeat protein